MTSVKVRTGGDPSDRSLLDRALRILKKKVDKEGTLKEFKASLFYDKPSVRKRAKSKAARRYRT
jgi:small subunit ribosomal protein S21